jgi:homogentisate 1,2-dioxygenase
MVDTFRPLELGEGGLAVDDGQYAWSWGRGQGGRQGAEGPADGSDYSIG